MANFISLNRKNQEKININLILSVCKSGDRKIPSILFVTVTGYSFTRIYGTEKERDEAFEHILKVIR